MKLGVALIALAMMLLGSARSAEAALTSSEKGQIRDFLARGQAENAGRVRSLVARTDLTAEESIAALTEAVAPVPFNEPRAIFLRELTFGVSSASSRPLLALAVVRALTTRADAVFQKYVGGLDHEPNATTELVAIYAFLDGAIANAGRPTLDAHDATAGISAAAYGDCAKALRDHLDRNARWLKGDGMVAESVGRVRAQAQAALLDMLPYGLTRRVDAVERLGLKGARRQMLIDWGILLQDAGKLDEPKSERVRQLLAHLPGARVDLELVYAGEDHGPLRARGVVAHVGGKGDGNNPLGEELTPVTIDAPSSAMAHDFALLAVKHALDSRKDLRHQAEQDAAAAQGDPGRILGKARAPSVEHVTAAAAHLLVLDASRAIDLAFVRVIGGRPESAALLSDAIGALAAFPIPGPRGTSEPKGLSLELGKAGGTAATTMTAIRLAPSGAALGFTVDGHSWSIERPAPSFAVTGVTRDGQPLSLAYLASARTPLREGTSWSEAGFSFSKLRGSPRAGLAPAADKGGPTVKVVGGGARGFDFIATSTPGDDFVVEGDLSVRGGPGGIAIRAVNGREAVRGAMLVVTPGGRTALITSDDTGGESLLAAPIDPTPPMPVHVKITVKGTKIEAIVGATTLVSTLPATVSKGEVGLVAKRGASVDLAGFSLKRK